jgi:hypothetical protein
MSSNLSTATDYSTPSSSSITTSTKPAFEKFSKEELNYLKERLPEYIAANNEGPTKKGEKGEWVTRKIFPDFKSRFGYSSNADGSSMESINMVRLCICLRHC